MQAIRYVFARHLFLILIVIAGAACSQATAGYVDVASTTAEPTEQSALATRILEEGTTTTPAPTEAAPGEAAVPAHDGVGGGRSLGDPYAPELGNTGYDVGHYDLVLNVDPLRQDYLEGRVTIEATAVIDQLGELSLDFIGMTISELKVDGQPADFRREGDKLIVTLPQPAAADREFEIEIAYAGNLERRPSPYVGFAAHLGMFFAQEDSVYVLSEPDGSRYWFPNNDHPRDKATYRFEITVPDGYTGVANGRLLAEEGNTSIWEHDRPLASYLATVVVGADYLRLEDQSPAGRPLRHYAFADHQTAFEQSTQVTGEALDWMSDLFGGYPFDEYGYVTVHAPGVSLETQTMVLLSTGMLNERTVIHELAHMWFGDWVSLDSWGEMWRNEGFATYLSIMWEHRDDPEGLASEMAGVQAGLEERAPTFPPLKNPPQADLFGSFTYFGGALMAHELRQQMGDEAFFAGLRTYFETYGGGVASDEEFIAVMEAAAGKSLQAFFDRWLDGNGNG